MHEPVNPKERAKRRGHAWPTVGWKRGNASPQEFALLKARQMPLGLADGVSLYEERRDEERLGLAPAPYPKPYPVNEATGHDVTSSVEEHRRYHAELLRCMRYRLPLPPHPKHLTP